jgi:hypothetical protein
LIIIKKKFENFKNSNNKIMIILFFSFCIASPFQDPPQKFGLLMGGIEPPKRDRARRRIWEGNTTHHFAHSHNKLSW